MNNYMGDTRYEKVWEQMQLLGIEDVTSKRQAKNGTRVWKLPIKDQDSGILIEVASFKTGYVRNQGKSTRSNFQLNKRCESEPEYYKTDKKDWCGRPLYNMYTTRTCKLIPIEIDRLEYLISYCLKNYYIKNANRVADGEYVPKWKLEHVVSSSGNDFNGQRDRIRDLENKLDTREEMNNDLECANNRLLDKLSNAISPTKYQCAMNKLHDLENKLATIQRIADYEE